MKRINIKNSFCAIVVILFSATSTAGLFDDFKKDLQNGLKDTVKESFNGSGSSSDDEEDEAAENVSTPAASPVANPNKPSTVQAKSSVASSQGKTVIGKLHGSPSRTMIGRKLGNGEFGSKQTDYVLTLGLKDLRNPPVRCNQYYHDQYKDGGHISNFQSDIDKLTPMIGKEIILENVRKSRVGKACVFSSYRLNTDTASTAGKGIGDIGKGMAPAGNRLVDKVSVMGVHLCGNLIQAGDYLEGLGYKNAALHARKLGRISNASKQDGIDNSIFTAEGGGTKSTRTIGRISFHGSFKDGPNLFEREKASFERETGIRLNCSNNIQSSSGRITICKYPEGDPYSTKSGFSYSITHEKQHKSFYIDAAAWGYPGCGR